jgi:hypothetical protein
MSDMAGAGHVETLRLLDDEREVGWDDEAAPEAAPGGGWIDDDLAWLLGDIPPHHIDR